MRQKNVLLKSPEQTASRKLQNIAQEKLAVAEKRKNNKLSSLNNVKTRTFVLRFSHLHLHFLSTPHILVIEQTLLLAATKSIARQSSITTEITSPQCSSENPIQ